MLVALTDLPAGDTVLSNNRQVALAEDIPAKYKFVEQEMLPGEEIILYGTLVGKAVSVIPAGARLSTENVKHQADSFTGKTNTLDWHAPDVSRWAGKTFMGYHCVDGQVGTANYWLVIPLVFCENRNVNTIKLAFLEELASAARTYIKRMCSRWWNCTRLAKQRQSLSCPCSAISRTGTAASSITSTASSS